MKTRPLPAGSETGGTAESAGETGAEVPVLSSTWSGSGSAGDAEVSTGVVASVGRDRSTSAMAPDGSDSTAPDGSDSREWATPSSTAAAGRPGARCEAETTWDVTAAAPADEPINPAHSRRTRISRTTGMPKDSLFRRPPTG